MAASAGYSGTPQAKKLGIKPGHRVHVDQAPKGWTLTDPPGELIHVEAPDPADVIVSFYREAGAIPERLADLAPRIYPAGAIWIAWPRRAAGHVSDVSDVSDNIVRQHALDLGLVDTKVAALDEDWSALKMVWRKEHRGAT